MADGGHSIADPIAAAHEMLRAYAHLGELKDPALRPLRDYVRVALRPLYELTTTPRPGEPALDEIGRRVRLDRALERLPPPGHPVFAIYEAGSPLGGAPDGLRLSSSRIVPAALLWLYPSELTPRQLVGLGYATHGTFSWDTALSESVTADDLATEACRDLLAALLASQPDGRADGFTMADFAVGELDERPFFRTARDHWRRRAPSSIQRYNTVGAVMSMSMVLPVAAIFLFNLLNALRSDTFTLPVIGVVVAAFSLVTATIFVSLAWRRRRAERSLLRAATVEMWRTLTRLGITPPTDDRLAVIEALVAPPR